MVFQTGCTNGHSHQESMRVRLPPFFPFTVAILLLNHSFSVHCTGKVCKLEPLYGQHRKPNITKPHKQTFRAYHVPFRNDLIISHLLVNLLPRDRSKYYQNSIPQTCQRLLVGPGSPPTLPLGPVTLQLNPVDFVQPRPGQAAKGCDF